jgi:hypothetical protein
MHSDRNVVEVEYQVLATDLRSARTETIHELHRVRYLFRDEIEHMLARTGFACEAAEEWASGAPLGTTTWSAVVIARVLP